MHFPPVQYIPTHTDKKKILARRRGYPDLSCAADNDQELKIILIEALPATDIFQTLRMQDWANFKSAINSFVSIW